MAKLYYEKDADPKRLDGKTVAIIGYGSQGHAHALNLKDSGVNVVVGLYEGSASAEKAKSEGLIVKTVAEATKDADIVMVLIPDTKQKKVYEESIAPNLQAGNTLMFAHGFNIRYGQIKPPDNVDVSLVAPKSPGHRVRELYVDGQGTPGLLAVHQDATGEATPNAIAYSQALGCARAGVIETTFEEETETDLFGEQAVLCGGVSALIQAGFETLTEAGYQPEIAYFECLHELKLIVDLIYEGGIEYMYYSVSNTAEHGGYTGENKIVTDETRKAMREMLADVRSGKYAQGWIDEVAKGRNWFYSERRKRQQTELAEVGKKLRQTMPFMQERSVPTEEKVPV
jgi:ketol-acid reductoisomerase